MGCWNGTCGVSQLPIHHGEPVRLFLLVPSGNEPNPNCMVHNTSLYEPGWFPIRAKYNDYGSVEGIEDDWNSRFVHAALKERAEKPTTDSLQDLIDQTERGNFRILTERYGIGAAAPHVPSLFMVRENIYTTLASIIDPDSWRLPTTEEGWTLMLEKAMETVAPSEPTEEIEDKEKELDALIRKMRMFDRDSMNPLLATGGEGLMYFDRGYQDLLCDSDVDTQREVLQMRMEYMRFSLAMSSLRKTWIAQSGQGSQHSLDITHGVMAGLYQSEMDSIDRSFEE